MTTTTVNNREKAVATVLLALRAACGNELDATDSMEMAFVVAQAAGISLDDIVGAADLLSTGCACGKCHRERS